MVTALMANKVSRIRLGRRNMLTRGIYNETIMME